MFLVLTLRWPGYILKFRVHFLEKPFTWKSGSAWKVRFFRRVDAFPVHWSGAFLRLKLILHKHFSEYLQKSGQRTIAITV